LRIAVPREIHPGERRVAATPETLPKLAKLGFQIAVESGAGEAAGFTDAAYEAAGATIVTDTRQLWADADVVIKIRPPTDHPSLGCHESELLHEGVTLVSSFAPAQNPELVERCRAKGASILALDAIPRVTRAQKMDVLSSMANIAGYRAVVEAAQHFGRFFTGQITAAGKVPPAKVLVLGAGVAGLAAIGAARGLGAVVFAFDTRPAVKEQVESMGATFVTVEFEEEGEGGGGYAKEMSAAFIAAEHALIEKLASEVDIIITTALIPGKPAPLLVTEKAIANLRPGSVIVDLAAERGGNAAFTRKDEVIDVSGVKILGYTDLPSRMANVSSTLFGTNIFHLLSDMTKAGKAPFGIDEDDLVIRGALVANRGELRWPPPPPPKLDATSPASGAANRDKPKPVKKGHGHQNASDTGRSWLTLGIVGVLLFAVGMTGSDTFLAHFTVFVLACFVGWQVVWNVTAALHTPLMSVTNAISGIIIVGGLLQVGGPITDPAVLLGIAAILFATINIAGGFLVTSRMLKMFHR
jgi:NAD(P) transhydrogenase subunit alpha